MKTLIANGETLPSIRKKLSLSKQKLDTRLKYLIEEESYDTISLVHKKFEISMEALAKKVRQLVIDTAADATVNVDERMVAGEDGIPMRIKETVVRTSNPMAAVQGMKLLRLLYRDGLEVAQSLGLLHKEPDRKEVTGTVLHAHLHTQTEEQLLGQLEAIESVNMGPKAKLKTDEGAEVIDGEWEVVEPETNAPDGKENGPNG